MKAISVSLENLKNGMIRVTGHNHGCTVDMKEGTDAKALLAAVMAKTCFAHKTAQGYDLTHVELNAAALAIL